VLDLRLYRVTLLPFAIGLLVVAFSLHPGPTALSSSQPAPRFDAQQAYGVMIALGSAGGDPAPGSAADDALARAIAVDYGLRADNFQSVRIVRTQAQTTAGARTIDTVIARRFGTGPGIALIADRGGPGRASALAATATLLEIADVFRNTATKRSLTLVFTAGGASGLKAAAAELPAGIGGAIVVGQPPAALRRAVNVVPWSPDAAIAPAQLRVTVESALSSGLGVHVADAGLADQFARLALPLTVGEQGPLLAAGIPAVLVSGAGGEGTVGIAQQVGPAALGAFGQSIVAATSTLGAGAGAGLSVTAAPTRDLTVGSQTLDGWAVRLLAGLLLVSLAACTLDLLARSRRRKAPVGRAFGWVLSFAAPFVLAALFALFLAVAALLPATPAAPVTSAQLPLGGAGVAALVSVGLLFVLAWVLRGATRRGRAAPEPIAAAAALLATGCMLAFLVWLGNPFTALLVIVPLHVWLVALTREPARVPVRGALALALSLLVPVAAVVLVCLGLSISPVGLAWMLLLLIGGGGVSFAGLLLGGLACGCAVAAGTLLLAPAVLVAAPAERARQSPLGYAGPGSLGGTRSALRR
jgi:hypothetical protein